ncbi:hypothetical protein CBOM_00540 [Ceraceosorus bombacis]|uniref:Uncharacterized protein n=1 Tax=Ceraceosorus bombacis TaxID=401625 RepID=A0A0P1B9N3_9BASI|nr:hypothetical protein CBOM_00540 [Ceraceosorus bombacis]
MVNVKTYSDAVQGRKFSASKDNSKNVNVLTKDQDNRYVGVLERCKVADQDCGHRNCLPHEKYGREPGTKGESAKIVKTAKRALKAPLKLSKSLRALRSKREKAPIECAPSKTLTECAPNSKTARAYSHLSLPSLSQSLFFNVVKMVNVKTYSDAVKGGKFPTSTKHLNHGTIATKDQEDCYVGIMERCAVADKYRGNRSYCGERDCLPHEQYGLEPVTKSKPAKIIKTAKRALKAPLKLSKSLRALRSKTEKAPVECAPSKTLTECAPNSKTARACVLPETPARCAFEETRSPSGSDNEEDLPTPVKLAGSPTLREVDCVKVAGIQSTFANLPPLPRTPELPPAADLMVVGPVAGPLIVNPAIGPRLGLLAATTIGLGLRIKGASVTGSQLLAPACVPAPLRTPLEDAEASMDRSKIKEMEMDLKMRVDGAFSIPS